MGALRTGAFNPDDRQNGRHNHTAYAQLLWVLHRQRASGVLEIRMGPCSRWLHWLEGQPVLYWSNLPEDQLSQSLVYAGRLSREAMDAVVENMPPGAALADTLVALGLVTWPQVDAHLLDRLFRGIGAALLWATGDWSWTPCTTVRADRIDARLCPQVSTLEALWAGVTQHVPVDRVLPLLTLPETGKLYPGPDFGSCFPRLVRLAAEYQGLPEALQGGSHPVELFKRFPDSGENLARLLWFLSTTGLLVRSARPPTTVTPPRPVPRVAGRSALDPRRAAQRAAVRATDEIPTSAPAVITPAVITPAVITPAAVAPAAATPVPRRARVMARASTVRASKPVEPAALEIAAEIESEWVRRAGQDFYRFLGLPRDCSRFEIITACDELASRWTTAQSCSGLSEDVQERIRHLLVGVRLVLRTLTDSNFRAEYDRGLAAGTAPRVRDHTAETSRRIRPPRDLFLRARSLTARGQFDRALAVLVEAREGDPLSAEILAELAWAAGQLRSGAGADHEPVALLRQALALDPRHSRALEVFARIAVAEQGPGQAAERLRDFLAICPSALWAREALAEISRGRVVVVPRRQSGSS